MRWRIGNGAGVRAFVDPWLPVKDNFKPITPLCFLHELVKVGDFIHDGAWREDLLKAIFCPRDVELIYKIPLCRDFMEDCLIWNFTPTGLFKVSSVYKLGLQWHRVSTASGSSLGLNWTMLWQCDLPPKVTLFTWQLYHNLLAIGINLHRRQIKQNTSCSRCSDPYETDLHIFFFCPYAKAAWKAHSLYPFKYLHKATSWLHFFQLMVDDHNGSLTVLSQIIICLWGLWGARNAWIFSGTQTLGSVVLRQSLDFLSSFQDAAGVDNRQDAKARDTNLYWRVLAEGCLKLNTDASYSTYGAGYGFVLRDHSGNLILTRAGNLLKISSAEHDEILAAWKSLEQIRMFWDRNITLETNCLRLVKQVELTTKNLSPNSGCIDAFKIFLQCLGDCKIVCCPRKSNSVAHSLARVGRSLDSEILWKESSHPCVMDVLHQDWLYIQ